MRSKESWVPDDVTVSDEVALFPLGHSVLTAVDFAVAAVEVAQFFVRGHFLMLVSSIQLRVQLHNVLVSHRIVDYLL